MSTFGHTTQEATNSGVVANRYYAFGPWSPAEDGLISKITAFFQSIQGNTVAGLYLDVGGIPDTGALITQSAAHNDAGSNNVLIDFSVTSAQIHAANAYWFVFNCDTGNTFVHNASDPGPQIEYLLTSQTYSATLASTFPTGGFSVGNGETFTIYGTYTPSLVLTPSPPLGNGDKSSLYSKTFGASGGTGPYTFARTAGTLPTGLTLTTGAVLSGTPTATGAFTFTITATDTITPFNTGSQAYTVTINYPLVITTTRLPNGLVGTAYSQTLSATGGSG